MSRSASTLYVGRVTHTRLRPVRHHFGYRVFYLMLDIDELPAVDRRLRLFSAERFNLFGFSRFDHGPRDGSSLRSWADGALSEAGIDLEGGPVKLLCFPRVLGYVFDPLSIWYCYHADGSLRAVIHEVKNTFGEQHSYVVPVDRANLQHEFRKLHHVSPFMGMDSEYRFNMNVPDGTLSVGIRQYEEAGELFRAGLSGRSRALTDGNLLRLFFTHPLVTLKAVGAIHFQALRLWIRGARYRPRPPAPSDTVSWVDRVRT